MTTRVGLTLLALARAIAHDTVRAKLFAVELLLVTFRVLVGLAPLSTANSDTTVDRFILMGTRDRTDDSTLDKPERAIIETPGYTCLLLAWGFVAPITEQAGIVSVLFLPLRSVHYGNDICIRMNFR